AFRSIASRVTRPHMATRSCGCPSRSSSCSFITSSGCSASPTRDASSSPARPRTSGTQPPGAACGSRFSVARTSCRWPWRTASRARGCTCGRGSRSSHARGVEGRRSSPGPAESHSRGGAPVGAALRPGGAGLPVPRIQFERGRRSRRTRPGWIRRARYDVAYDVVTGRSHGLARTFQELKLRQLAAGRPGLDAVAAAFQERYALRPLLVGKVDRAERLLREIESDALTSAARGGREVAVIVVEAGCVAVRMDEGSLTLPVRGGRGEEACRDVLRVHCGRAHPEG